MDKMSFGVYDFQTNPDTFAISAVRSPQYAIDDDGNITYDGLGPLCRTITGSGVFTGKYAYEFFNGLAVVMATGTLGELKHPVWGVIKAYLTGLEMKQDSREDYVEYSFTFREADESGMIPQLPESE